MPILLDTGILLRLFEPADQQCPEIRGAIRLLMRRSEILVTSFQNLAEFHNVSTRPASARGGYGLAPALVENRTRLLERLTTVVTESATSFSIWKQLVRKYDIIGVAVHDARLVATMIAHGVTHVLTLNEHDLRRYSGEGISVETPGSIMSAKS